MTHTSLDMHSLRAVDFASPGQPRNGALLAIADTERVLACAAAGLPISGAKLAWMSVRQTLARDLAPWTAGEVTVATRVAGLGNSSLQVAQTLRAGEAQARVATVMVLVDRTDDRPTRIPDAFRDALRAAIDP